jgi:hypothetical protein
MKTQTYNTYLPVIISQGSPLPLGCQIEGHVGNRAKWIVPDRQYQISVKWRDVETNKGERDWSGYDLDFEALSGQRVTVGVKCVPEWARLWPGYVGSPPLAHYYTELAMFIVTLIERYHPDAIELFNEPDVDRDAAKWAEEFFGAWVINNDFYRAGKLYGQCLNTVYSMVHEAYPVVRIIAGALMSHADSLKFLDGAIDGGLKCDAISFHKYISMGGSFSAAFEFALDVANRINKPVVLSETSVLAQLDSDELMYAQADYLRYLRENYRDSCIDVVQWYSLASNDWMNSDLIHGGQLTPAYEVFTNAV